MRNNTKKKQTRPLYIPKPENGDFPFSIQDIEPGEIKPIDFFRMYNCLKMVVEKLCPEQAVQAKLHQHIDHIFRVFIERDHNPPQPQKLVGRRNSPHTYQKEEFWNYIENLNSLGYSYKQLSERLQVHYVQISTHHRNTVTYEESEEELSAHQKKSSKERLKQEQLLQQQSNGRGSPVQEHEVFHSDDEKK